MKSTFLHILGAGTLALSAIAPAHAAQSTIGPFKDFQQTFTPVEVINGGFGSTQTNIYVYYSTFYPYPATNTVCNPYNPSPPGLFCSRLFIPDRVDIGPSPFFPVPNFDTRVAGASYLTYETGDLTFTFTTIYGEDVSTAGTTDLAIAGFAKDAAPIDFISEQVIGKSGTAYPASTRQLVSLSDLPSVLGADFDLTPLQGDPTSQFYVFETTVPFAEVTSVPESSSPFAIALSVLAATVSTAAIRNRRTRSPNVID